jgi:hypothetical protein
MCIGLLHRPLLLLPTTIHPSRTTPAVPSFTAPKSLFLTMQTAPLPHPSAPLCCCVQPLLCYCAQGKSNFSPMLPHDSLPSTSLLCSLLPLGWGLGSMALMLRLDW